MPRAARTKRWKLMERTNPKGMLKMSWKSRKWCLYLVNLFLLRNEFAADASKVSARKVPETVYHCMLTRIRPNSLKFTNQPASYTFLLILPFFVFPLCTRTRLVRDLFLMLHRLSGTVSLAKLGHQTHSHLSYHP